MRISSKLFICLSILIIVLIGLAACAGNDIISSEEADWQTAIDILHSGQVTEVMQLHNLQVTLTLEDGSQVKTIEPSIDEIFREVERCGQKCDDILLSTE